MHRRTFLAHLVVPLVSAPAAGAAELGGLRGSLDATELGVRTGTAADQTAVLQRAIDRAAAEKRPLFLPAGRYLSSTLRLPSDCFLLGMPGATRLTLAGPGPLLASRRTRNVTIDGVVADGSGGTIADPLGGLASLAGVVGLTIVGCDFEHSPKSGLALTACSGRIVDNRISGAGEYAVYSLDATGLAIRGNSIADCANGGILVHRSDHGEDGTLVADNRIARIGADNGGTGQWGNGINVYRAGNVVISGNSVSDCAFSAIRSNGGSNVQIVANNCRRSGETALYSEFAFEGAVIANNVVDGAANGISIANFLEGGRMAVCANNIVRNLVTTGPYPADPPGFGVGIWAEADTTVTGNVVENAPLYGIALGWGPYLRNVTATGNVVRNAGVGIAVSVVEGAGKAVIANNVIDDTPRGAVVGFRWAERSTEDLTIVGADDWAHLRVEGNS